MKCKQLKENLCQIRYMSTESVSEYEFQIFSVDPNLNPNLNKNLRTTTHPCPYKSQILNSSAQSATKRNIVDSFFLHVPESLDIRNLSLPSDLTILKPRVTLGFTG
jgi:hypothetical protein